MTDLAGRTGPLRGAVIIID